MTIDEFLTQNDLFYIETLQRGWTVVAEKGLVDAPGTGVPVQLLLKMYPDYIVIAEIRKVTSADELRVLMAKVEMKEEDFIQRLTENLRDDPIVMSYSRIAV